MVHKSQKVIPIQFQEQMVAEIEGYLGDGLYSSKAEFIREAVRRLILELRKEHALRLLEANFGKGKGKTPVLTEEMKADIAEKYLKDRKSNIFRKVGLE